MSYEPLVTCVVPIYNAEKYLAQAVQSLLSQTYKNLEIILVDDYSADGSWSICQRYRTQHSNILCFRNKVNSGGPLRGRELGIQKSRGEWITFMDGDDYVGQYYIENLVKATKNGTYDIAVTGHSRLYAGGRKKDFLWESYTQTTPERLTAFYQHLLTHNFCTDPTDTIGQQLVRAKICKSTDLSYYSNAVFAEDTLMALAFLANSKSGINFVDTHDFMWRQVEGSGSHGGFLERANQSEFYVACMNIFHRADVYSTISEQLPRISLIVPAYNVEKYIGECLESAISQTYQNVEIIVVNDGSEDESQAVISSFKRRDHRIISLTQKNKGLNMARAAGVKVASGDFITFVDSDDVLHPDYLKILYENLLTNNVDISIAGFEIFYTKKDLAQSKPELTPDYSQQVLRDGVSVMRYYLGDLKSVPNIYQMTAWGKLFKAEIIKETDWQLANYRRHEDNLESLQWYCRAQNGIAAISTPLYYYRINKNSITSSVRPNIGPDGEILNYFQWLNRLYRKTAEYVNNNAVDVAIVNQFAHTNSIQLREQFLKGQVDKEGMMSAIDNWGELIILYNQQIQQRDERITYQQNIIKNIEGSPSWRLTAPVRKAKSLLIRIYRTLRAAL